MFHCTYELSEEGGDMKSNTRWFLGIAVLTAAVIGINWFVSTDEEEVPLISFSEWTKSPSEANLWVAQVEGNHDGGTLEITFIDKSLIFIMKRTCTDSQNVESISWTLGNPTGKWITCQNLEKIAFTPPLIEKAMRPLPDEVLQFIKKSRQLLPPRLMIKVADHWPIQKAHPPGCAFFYI